MRPKTKVFLALLFLAVFTFPSALESRRPEDRKISLIFRYDDYSALSATAFEKALIGIFQKNGVPCTFGVVPSMSSGDLHDPAPQPERPLTPEKVALLKEAVTSGIVEAGLHGYNHQTIRSGKSGFTEFSGAPFTVQDDKIVRGKKALEKEIGREVTLFIPPWNRYDPETVRSLEKNGFTVLSGDFDGPAPEDSALQFVPATTAVHKVRRGIRMARWNPGLAEPLIVVLFHGDDFKEVDPAGGKITLPEFSDLISWAAAQDDIRIRSIREVTAGQDHFNVRKYRIYQAFHRLVPVAALELLFPLGAYSIEAPSMASVWRSAGVALLIYASIFWIFAVAARKTILLFFRRSRSWSENAVMSAIAWALPALIVAAALYGVQNSREYSYFLAAAAVIGAGAGSLRASRQNKQNKGLAAR